MRTSTLFLASAAALVLLDGCSGNGLTPSPSIQPAPPAAIAVRADRGAGPAVPLNLYVANAGTNSIDVYHPGTSIPMKDRTIIGLDGPDAIAFDQQQNLYVANANGNSVGVYPPESTKLSYSLTGGKDPTGVAFDGSGNTYVANQVSNTVTIFQKGTANLLQTLSSSQFVASPRAIAFDKSGYLYVANGETVAHPHGSITVYYGTPPSVTYQWTITTDIDQPQALALDSHGRLYVADEENNSVSIYNPSSSKNSFLHRIPSTDINEPDAIALDSSSNVYVANALGDTVAKFRAGSWQLMEVISTASRPTSLAFGSAGWLNIAETGTASEIQEFSGGTGPGRTITDGIDSPTAIAFGP